jgi:hypothetical protein
MNLKLLMLGLGTVALTVASAASSYEMVLSSPTWVGNTQLKPGTYKLALQGDKAVFSMGRKKLAEVPAKVEKGDRKVQSTEVETANSRIREIRLGGTTSKLEFAPGASGDSPTAAH